MLPELVCGLASFAAVAAVAFLVWRHGTSVPADVKVCLLAGFGLMFLASLPGLVIALMHTGAPAADGDFGARLGKALGFVAAFVILCYGILRWLRHGEDLRRRLGEARRTERAVIEGRDALRALVDAVPAFLSLTDSNSRYVHMNRFQAGMLGTTPKAAAGKLPGELLGAERGAEVEALDRELRLTGETRSFFEEPFVDARGAHHDMLTTKVPLRDAAGAITGVATVSLDITKRKRVEDALWRSEARFRDFAASASDYFWEMDENLRFSYFSERFSEVTGVPTEHLLGRTREETGIPNVDEEMWRRHLADLAAHRAFRGFVHPRILPDGREVWLSIDGTPIFDEDGRFIGYRGTGADITDRRRAGEQLRRRQQEMRLIADNVPAVLTYVDHELRYRFTNRQFEQWFGHDSQSVIGRTVEEVIGPENFGPLRHYVDRALAGERVSFEMARDFLPGGARWVSATYVPDIGEDGAVRGLYTLLVDVTRARQLSEELSYQAAHDPLTELINRREFERRLQRALETARDEDATHALCYLDLDQFKIINDSCGHVAGDELLRQLGRMLPDKVRKRDSLARLGGDEFGVLMERCNLRQARRVASALRQAVEEHRFQWEGKTFQVGVSIGLVPVDAASDSVDGVLRAADSACYAAKDGGRNRIHVYRADDAELLRRQGELQWVTRIGRALDEQRLHLALQPIVPAGGGSRNIEHFELLLRMDDEDGRLVLPGAFLPAAERYHLATRLDRWVVESALDWLAGDRDRLSGVKLCAINLSGTSLGNDELLEFIGRKLAATRVPASKICFEVTETGAIENLTNALHFLGALRARGCRFALDDFGNGLSSFAYLKQLPVDFVKIDGMFVRDVLHDPIDSAMVRSINEIGQVMGKQTIAEFVEDDSILERVREIGVDFVQGYAVGRPVPLDGVARLRLAG